MANLDTDIRQRYKLVAYMSAEMPDGITSRYHRLVPLRCGYVKRTGGTG